MVEQPRKPSQALAALISAAASTANEVAPARGMPTKMIGIAAGKIAFRNSCAD